MPRVRVVFACVFLLVLLTSCKPSAPAPLSNPSQPSPRSARATGRIEACALLTKEEVGALQSTTISDIKSSEGPGGNYLITQCYYSATGPNLSVSLAVTQRDPKNPSAPSPREQWKQIFDRFDKENEAKAKEEVEKEGGKEHGREEEEGEKMQPPKKIDGVGEEAFWSGNRFGGALYVLKGDAFIRVSVGGPDNEGTKIEKSKTLAQKALGRLP
jgi:hypothetical protein